MDNRPVGVFDSGLGGLTAVRAIREILPGQDILYLGDTARVPYGTRSREVIIRYSMEHVGFMLRRNVKALVVACGTMSAIAMEAMTKESPVPVLGVVEPSSKAAVAATKNRRVGVISTQATADSGVYAGQLAALDPECEVFGLSCPLFVPLVEAGRVSRGDVVIETVTAEYLAPMRECGVDTLLLGCTHYPLLMEVIGDYMGAEVSLIDSGAAVACALKDHLSETGSLSEPGHTGTTRFFVTDSAAQFDRLSALFLRENRNMENPTFGIADRVDIQRD